MANAAVEYGAKGLEFRVAAAQSVAVGKEEYFAIDVCNQRFAVDYHSALPFQIVAEPHVVVSGKEMHFYSAVCKFAYLSEKTRKAFWHDIFVLIPKIKHIAEQIYCRGVLLDVGKKPNKPPFLCAAVGGGKRTKVGVRNEIHVFHRKRDIFT